MDTNIVYVLPLKETIHKSLKSINKVYTVGSSDTCVPRENTKL